MALVSLVTLVPANIIARQRPSWKPRGPPQMDWTAFRDVPYLLMMAGEYPTAEILTTPLTITTRHVLRLLGRLLRLLLRTHLSLFPPSIPISKA